MHHAELQGELWSLFREHAEDLWMNPALLAAAAQVGLTEVWC